MKPVIFVVLAALSTFALAGACGPVECPAKEGFNSCGYCAEDVVFSSNPNAGMCTYCRSACGDDPCHPACDSGGGGGGCDSSWVSKCGTTSGGIQFLGAAWPKTCGGCPQGTYYHHDDNTTAGGPYSFCMCNGF